MSDTPKVIPTAEHARNLERQLAAARRERDEAKRGQEWLEITLRELGYTPIINNDGIPDQTPQEFMRALVAERDRLREELAMAKADASNYKGANISKAAEISQIRAALATAQAEAAELRAVLVRLRKAESYYAEKAMTQNQAAEECVEFVLAQEQADKVLAALAAERDHAREENGYLTANLLLCEDSLKQAESADIAKLCCVIAAAFAETAKPLNASVEYDATPTAAERLKKVQEILSSAIDAADHGARDYQAAQAEAAAVRNTYAELADAVRNWLKEREGKGYMVRDKGEEVILRMFKGEAAIDAASTDQITEPSMVPMPSQFGTHPHDMAVGPCACGATHKLTDWPKAVRDALDAASATEAKRIPVKVRMAKNLGPDLWAIMAPNTPRFWVKKGDEVPVKCNQHGAMTLLTPHGELGVKPQECEIIEWQYPASATEGGQP